MTWSRWVCECSNRKSCLSWDVEAFKWWLFGTKSRRVIHFRQENGIKSQSCNRWLPRLVTKEQLGMTTSASPICGVHYSIELQIAKQTLTTSETSVVLWIKNKNQTMIDFKIPDKSPGWENSGPSRNQSDCRNCWIVPAHELKTR